MTERKYPWMAHPAGSLPHRIDWYRVAVMVAVVAGSVAFWIGVGFLLAVLV